MSSALYDVQLYLTQARQVLGEQDIISDDDAVIHLELSMLLMDVQLLIERDAESAPTQESLKWN